MWALSLVMSAVIAVAAAQSPFDGIHAGVWRPRPVGQVEEQQPA